MKNVLNVSVAENVLQAYTKERNKVKVMIRKSKKGSKEILVSSLKVIQKYSGHMLVVTLKRKPAWHLSYSMKKMKLQQNLATRKRKKFFQNNFLVFLQKNRMLKCPFSIKKTGVNLPNINITEEMVQNKILKLNVNKSCGPNEMHPQILIELVDLIFKSLALLLNKTKDE